MSEGEKAVDDIFVALSECTSLHPCVEEDSECEFDGDESEYESSEPQKKINKLDEERFEDSVEK